MPMLSLSVALTFLCFSLPIVIVEQITGLWDVMESAMDDYIAMLSNFSYAAINDWAEAYSGDIGFSFASFLFILLVPGPLTLGLSQIWLNVIRGKQAYADMIFSGFGEFLRVVAMDTLRRVFMFLWAILFIIPGVIAYYRYSQAFFLIADNPEMKTFEALSYSKYYMRQNKGSRFFLDLSFVGWFAVSAIAYYFINGGILAVILAAGYDITIFTQFLVTSIAGSFIFAPVCAYRGVAAAEYYHRVICRNPKSFGDLPELPAK